MMFKKSKGVSPVGGIFLYNIILDPSDSLKCPECKRDHNIGDLVVCEYVRDIPTAIDLTKGLPLKYNGRVFCSKHKKIKGLAGIIDEIDYPEPVGLDPSDPTGTAPEGVGLNE